MKQILSHENYMRLQSVKRDKECKNGDEHSLSIYGNMI